MSKASQQAQFDAAIQQFSNGELPRAEMACRSILEKQPSHPDAWHLLGLIAAESGHLESAIECIEKAIHYAPAIADYHNSKGLVYMQMKQFELAEQALTQATGARKDYPDAWFNLGNCWRELQQPEKAIEAFNAVLKSHPDHLAALNNVANLYKEQGAIDQALSFFNRVISLSPDFSPAHYNRGLIYKQQGQTQQALEAFQRSLQIKPGFPDARYQLGRLQLDLKQYDFALANLQRVVAGKPDYPRIHYYLGIALAKDGQHEAAIKSLEQALATQPQDADVWNQMGLVYMETESLDEAERCFKSALEYDPEHFNALNNLGGIYQAIGDFDKATVIFNRLIEHHADRAMAWKNYANHCRFAETALPVFKLAENLLTEPSLSNDDKALLHFTLGKVYDDCAYYQQAFDHYQQGNTLRKQTVHYDRKYTEHLVDETIRVFTSDLFKAPPVTGADTDQPVFIVGMPRSSTSLVEQISASHSRVAGAGELIFFNRLTSHFNAEIASETPYPACIKELKQHHADRITSDYLQQLTHRRQSALRITDKMPQNFLHLGLIALLFPQARVIHCVRDPMDTCLSIFFHDFTGSNPYSHDLEDIAHFYHGYARLMGHWNTVLPLDSFTFDYAQMLAEPEATTRAMIDFLGLDWDPACLSFHETSRTVLTASDWQVRQPLFTYSQQRWKHYATWLEPLRQALEK